MGEHEVQQAVQAITADEELRASVAGGDLSGLDGELSDEEQAMVIAAAADFPEVAGFAFDLGLRSPKPSGCSTSLCKIGSLINGEFKCVPGTTTDPNPKR